MKYKDTPDPVVTAVFGEFTRESAVRLLAIGESWVRREDELLDAMRAALLRRDEARVHELACELCGFDEDPAA